MAYYNLQRSHQGYRLNGRTPAQALREGLGLDELPNLRYESAADGVPSQENEREPKEINIAPETT